jgi:hypothetical protein
VSYDDDTNCLYWWVEFRLSFLVKVMVKAKVMVMVMVMVLFMVPDMGLVKVMDG